MIIDGKVYDITKFQDEVKKKYIVIASTFFFLLIFVNQHPGGEEVLIDEGAKDATGPFEDVGHTDDARKLLEQYYIGDVDPAVSFFFYTKNLFLNLSVVQSEPVKPAKQAQAVAAGPQGK